MEEQGKGLQVSTIQVRHLIAIAVWVVAIGLCLYFLPAIKVLLLGMLAAGAMASALYPLTCFIPANRWVQAAVVGMLPIVGSIALLVLLSYLLSSAVAEQVRHWPAIQQQLDKTLATWSVRFGLEQPVTVASLLGQVGNLLTGSGGSGVFSTTTSFLGNVLIAITFIYFGGIFFLGEKPERLLRPVLLLVPVSREAQVRDALYWLVPKLRWWTIGTLISMTAIAVVSGIGYYMVGLAVAFPIAILAGVAQLVPTFGPLMTFITALLLAATEGPRVMLGVTIVYIIVQSLESYALTPYVMKRAAEMPPVVTLFTVVLWGQMLGLPGLLLAVPINLVIWAFAYHMLIRPHELQREERAIPDTG